MSGANRVVLGALGLVLLVAACGEPAGATDPTAWAADTVVSAPHATGEGFYDAELAVNGVRGGGEREGSLDVFTIGYDPGVNDHIVLRFSGARVTDGPGADLVVFENPFDVLPGRRFMDQVVVEVSRDGARFVSFPHDYVADDETTYSSDPESWLGFAGISPVYFHEEDNPVDPFDTEAAGGDAFDLSDLPDDDPEAVAIRREGAVYVRIVSAAARDNPDTGAPFPRASVSDGPDIDGVYGRYLAPAP